jgi:UDP-N-acetylmuramoylalanine--D-glutamate ligase
MRVTVMGLGRFGGGAGVVRWLAGHGAHVLATDLQPPSTLGASLDELKDLVADGRIALRLGGHQVGDFETCDLVVANPAVPEPWENPYLRAAEAAGVPITTEIRLATERLRRDRIIGVTGTAGKSTCAAMVHHVLGRSGRRAHFGGNIGGSLLNCLETIDRDDWVVLELSSAMLYWLGRDVGAPGRPGWSPHVAVMTNFAPNHLDWHGTLEHYRRCKRSIFAYQRPGDHALLTDDLDPAAPPVPLSIPGPHNQKNAQLAVAAACAAAGLIPEKAAGTLSDFAGLPHRLQLVAEEHGRRFYDDSKSTTPPATCLAVEAFDDPARVHLIAGGYDKGVDLAGIASLADGLAGLYTIGTTGRRLADAAGPHSHAGYFETLDRAAEGAFGRMRPGDVLLLSPGCASWDQFDNYEARGEAFCRLVWSYLGKARRHEGTEARSVENRGCRGTPP